MLKLRFDIRRARAGGTGDCKAKESEREKEARTKKFVNFVLGVKVVRPGVLTAFFSFPFSLRNTLTAEL